MAAINHTFVSQTSPQALGAGFALISGMTISSGFFTAGKKYLILASGQIYHTTAVDSHSQLGVYHGTTQVGWSLNDNRQATVNVTAAYTFMFVWTAVGGEAIELWGAAGAGGAASADQCFLAAINLSDDLVENTDWFYNENSSVTALSTTPATFATITFTPAVAGQDWLVLLTNNCYNTITNQLLAELVRSGEASSSTPSNRYSSISTDGNLLSVMARVFNLGSSSNTFAMRMSMVASTGGYHAGSAVFALNLNKFKNYASAYTDGDVALNLTDFGDVIQTISITPDIVSDLVIGEAWGFDKNNAAAAATAKQRVQIDGTDQPATQTSDNRLFTQAGATADEEVFSLMTMASSVSQAAHTIDLDASVSITTNTPTAQMRSLWAFTMELASAAPPSAYHQVGYRLF
jgi:hypothetical protein